MSKAKKSGMGSVKYWGGNKLLLVWNPLSGCDFSFECPGKPVGLSGIIEKRETFSITSVGDWLMEPPDLISMVSAVMLQLPGRYPYNQS